LLATVYANTWYTFEIVVDYHDDDATPNPVAGLKVNGSTLGAPLAASEWGHSMASPPPVKCLMVMANGSDQVHYIEVDNVTLRGRP